MHERASAVGTPAAAITSLAKAFDPSSRAAAADGPEHRDPPLADDVGHPRHQRCLGPDHDQVDAERGGQVGDRLTVHRVDVVQRRDAGHPGVAGGDVHLGDRRVAGQGEGQGVLAATGSDDEGLHVR